MELYIPIRGCCKSYCKFINISTVEDDDGVKNQNLRNMTNVNILSIRKIFNRHMNGSITVHADDVKAVDELQILRSDGMIFIQPTLTCTMTQQSMALAFPPNGELDHALVLRVSELLNDMKGKNITPTLYNTEIGGRLRCLGRRIKSNHIQSHHSEAADALVSYFNTSTIDFNNRYGHWCNILDDLRSYAHKDVAVDGRSNVFFDGYTISESDDE